MTTANTHLLEGSFGACHFPDGDSRNEDNGAAGEHPAEHDGPTRVDVGAVVGQFRVTVDAHAEHHLRKHSRVTHLISINHTAETVISRWVPIHGDFIVLPQLEIRLLAP